MITSEQLFSYLEKKIPTFIKTRKAKTGEMLFTCPNIANHKYKSVPSATFSPSGNIVCLICGWKGTMFDAIRVLEEDKHNKTDAEITDYLIGLLHLDMYAELNEYQTYGFALIPLLQNSKAAFEKGWTESQHRDKVQFIKWLNNNLNIGIRTGEVNGITVIDADFKVAPVGFEEIYKELIALNTLMQDTPHGKHFVIKYDKELQQTTKIGGIHLDIRNDGGQIVAAPSQIDTVNYKWVNLGTEIKNITPELKTKLLTLMENQTKNSIEIPEKEKLTEPLKLKNNNLDGCCNDTFVSIGGMLIKQLTPEHTEFVLNIMNRHLLESPMPASAIKSMLNSLADYKGGDEESEKQQIETYCKFMMTDIKADDIIKSVFKGNYSKRGIVDKYLGEFRKKGWLLRVGIGRYQCKEKITWTKEIPPALIEYPHTIPYFNDVSIFEDGDLLLLGARANAGKSTISLNMMREMIKQNVTPYYLISGEAGSRWQKTSQILDITGKFYRYFHQDPLQIELEYNAFTIIDWLHFDDKSQVDVVLKHLNDELQRRRGILVIFTQLKDNDSNDWFAPNLVHHYPTFAARYIQDNLEKTIGHWQIDKVKEMRGNQLLNIICEYNQETRIFKKKELI